jgi:endonuclease/exonuclease/phosphatase family metal-dependent hydrolase
MTKLVIIVPAAVIGGLVVIALLFLAGFFVFLSVNEYRPGEREVLEVRNPAAARAAAGSRIRVLSWNTGYASLGAAQDFFMDGGTMVRPPSEEAVRANLRGIWDFLSGRDCDAVLLQEVDSSSHRSWYVDEAGSLADAFQGSSVFAYNFLAPLVPWPVPEFIGKVASGLLTLNTFEVSRAERIHLPGPFRWPVRTVNLKHCLLVERLPVKDSDRELVLVNLHLEAYDLNLNDMPLEAYDEPDGRDAQVRVLEDFLRAEYAKGNYCIAGGDFNRTFPGFDETRFPLREGVWTPGVLSPSLLPEGWRYEVDLSRPSCRLLDKPWSGDYEDNQLYIIDGFILSPNVELVSVHTVNLEFRYSDHNPVELTAVLKRD